MTNTNSRKTYALRRSILIGNSHYEEGTEVVGGSEIFGGWVDDDDPDARRWVNFPNGEGTTLARRDLRPVAS